MMLALSPKTEAVECIVTTYNDGRFDDPCHLWVAVNQALNDVDDWADRYSHCTFTDHTRGRALVIEKAGGDRLRICHQQYGKTLLLPHVAVWLLTLDVGSVCDVMFGGAPADLAAMEELADLLWAFHRLAVQDQVPMLRE